MLAQIGTLVAPEVLQRYFGNDLLDDDGDRSRADAKVAHRLLESVPRLRTVAQMIDRQDQDPQSLEGLSAESYAVALGAQMLRVVGDFDRLVGSACSFQAALASMQQNSERYHSEVLAALRKLVQEAEGGPAMEQYLFRPIAEQVLRSLRT